jgi:ribose transport system permease protein
MREKDNKSFDAKNVKLLFQNRVLFIFIIIIIISIFTSIAYREFATLDNISTVLLNISIDAIVAIGMMILLISGVFDLSVGSVVGLSGAITAKLIDSLSMHFALAAIMAIVACLCIGLFNGMIIAKIGVNPLIETLAMLGICRGLVLVVAATGITRLPESFLKIADTTFLGFQIPVWYMIVIAGVFSLLLFKVRFFRRYYYLGGNVKAASLSGINVIKMRVFSFVLSSGLAGLAGVILTAKLGASIPTLGTGVELRTITACVLGGASLSGGYGTVLGAIVGIFFMGLINNLMVVTRMAVSWQSIVISGIMITVVTVDAFLSKGSVQ